MRHAPHRRCLSLSAGLAIFVLLFHSLLCMDAQAEKDPLPRIALIPSPADAPGSVKFTDLLLGELSDKGRVTLVEREAISKLCQEQEIRDLSQLPLSSGKALRAEMIGLISQTSGQTDRVQIVAMETRYGLRILEEDVLADEETSAGFVARRIEEMAALLSSGPLQVYCVPPMENEAASFQYDAYQNSLAYLLRSKLLSRGCLVVEFEEARRLLDEIQMTSGKDTQWPELTIVKGRFSPSVQGPLDLQVTVLRPREDPEILSFRLAMSPGEVASGMEEIVKAVIRRAGKSRETEASQVSMPDLSRWMADQGEAYVTVGSWDAARQCLEACLLIDPSSERLRISLLRAYNGLSRQDVGPDISRKEALIDRISLHARGTDHLEWLLRNVAVIPPEWDSKITDFMWSLVRHNESRAPDFAERAGPSFSQHLDRLLSMFDLIVQSHGEMWCRSDRNTEDVLLNLYGILEYHSHHTAVDKYEARLATLRVLQWRRSWVDGQLDSLLAPVEKDDQSQAYVSFLDRASSLGHPSLVEKVWLASQRTRGSQTGPPQERTLEVKGRASLSVPENVLRIEKVDVGLGGLPKQDPPQIAMDILRCGDYGDALWMSRSVIFLPCPGGVEAAIPFPQPEDAEVWDMQWEDPWLWVVLGHQGQGGPAFEILCWSPTKEGLRRWGPEEGLPGPSLAPSGGEEGKSGVQPVVVICPYRDRLLVAAAEAPQTNARWPRTWIGALSPDAARLEILFEAKRIDGEAQHLGAPEDEAAFGFWPGTMGILRVGQGDKDWRIVVSRGERRNWLVMDPETLRVDLWKEKSLVSVTPLAREELPDHAHPLLAGRSTAWISPDTGHVVAVCPFTFWRHTSCFSLGERLLLADRSLRVFDKERRDTVTWVPDLSCVKPALSWIGPSKNFGLLAYSQETASFYRVQLDDQAISRLIDRSKWLDDP